MSVNRELRQIANRQWGYFTAAQAERAGYPNNLRCYHCKAQNWLKIDRNLFRLGGYSDSAESGFTRWTLWAKGQNNKRVVVVSHFSALHYYGLCTDVPDAVHLTVSQMRHDTRIDGVHLYLDQLLDDAYTEREGFLITTPLRTLTDLRPDLEYANHWVETVSMAHTMGLIRTEQARQMCGRSVEEVPMIRTRQRVQSEWSTPGRSFTLIEMLVVIAVISILAAMLLPALNRSVEMARIASCANNQKNIYLSILTYTETYSGYLPAQHKAGEDFALNKLDLWKETCLTFPYSATLTTARQNVFTCPSQTAWYGGGGPGAASYGHNNFDAYRNPCYKIQSIKSASTFPFMACMAGGYSGSSMRTYPNFRGDITNLVDVISDKHNGEGGFLFLGGNARIFQRGEWEFNAAGKVPDWFPWAR